MGIFDRKTPPPRTFAEALMGDVGLPPAGDESGTTKVEGADLSEKGLVLESFTQFVQERLAETPALRFPGGEITRKTDPGTREFAPVHPDRVAWEAAEAPKTGVDRWKALRDGKNAHPSVMFVGESFSTTPWEGGGSVRDEFLHCFTAPVAELFQKMVQAMKLEPADYVLAVLKDERGEKTPQELWEEVWWTAPRYVVPLGAKACHAFLGPRERLAAIHGKFFPLSAFPSETQVVPLFHPGVIATNLNMKKSTWGDMQKLMQALGKA